MSNPEVTSVEEWKKSSGGAVKEPIELPSGKWAKIKTPGMEALLSGGSIPNSLVSIITEKIDPKKNEEVDPQVMMKDLLTDPTRIQELFELIDFITTACFVSPQVWALPAEGEDRKEDRLYVDEVDVEDKFFVFSVAVGGTSNLKQFRSELTRSVESAQSLVEVEHPTESVGRHLR